MAKPIIVEGQTATNPQTKEQIVYRGGKWYPVGGEPPAAGQTVGADAKARFALGLGPAVEAQKNLFEAERWNQSANNRLGSNPLSTLGGGIASVLAGDDSPNKLGNAAAKSIGGQRYQDYTQAAKTFESAFLPIMSGAAVTPSEAQRLIRASLPEMGDSPQTLAKKAHNRAMMINGAASLMGQPPPFPRVPTMSFGGSASKPAQAPRSSAPAERPSLDQIFGN